MKIADPLKEIYDVTITVRSGCTTHDAALAAHELKRILDCDVYFIHNDRRYKAELNISEVPPKTLRGEKP